MRRSITYRDVPLTFVFCILSGVLSAGTAIWSQDLLGLPRFFWGIEAATFFLIALLVPAHQNQKLFSAVRTLCYVLTLVCAVYLLLSGEVGGALVQLAFPVPWIRDLTRALNSNEI